MINETLEKYEKALVEVCDCKENQRKAIRQAIDYLKQNPTADSSVVGQLEIALKDGERIDTLLQQFQWPKQAKS